MSNFNRKGPENCGAMTGRKMGKCNPENKNQTEEEIFKMRAENNKTGQGLRRGLKLNSNQGFIANCFKIFGNSQKKGCGQGMGMRNRKNN